VLITLQGRNNRVRQSAQYGPLAVGELQCHGVVLFLGYLWVSQKSARSSPASGPGWMRFFAITLAGADIRAAGVEVAEVLEEMVAVAIASPFSPKGAYARTREFGPPALRSLIDAPTPVSGLKRVAPAADIRRQRFSSCAAGIRHQRCRCSRRNPFAV